MNIVIIGQNEGESIIKMLSSLILKAPGGKRLWVLDRCSDNSEQLLKSFGETYVKTPRRWRGRKTSSSRNLGLRLSGPLDNTLFLDGDRYISSGVLDFTKTISDVSLLLVNEDNRDNLDIVNSCGRVHNGFYSCGVYFKKSALEKILKFQNGELFSTKVEKTWGIEDTYLGDVCYHLGLSIDTYKDCRLYGKFEKTVLDNLDVIEKRFKLREKLNVKW